MTVHLHRNILKLYIFAAFEWMLFFIPVLYLFYQSIGLSTQDVFIVQAIFALIIAIFEVPSGYIADYLGRKKTLIAGTVLMLIGTIWYAQSQNFTDVTIAEIFLGMGMSLRSGVKEAILYDSLLLLQEEGQFKYKQGMTGTFGQISEGVSSIIGAMLATLSLRLPFYMEMIAVFCALMIAFTFHEPKRERVSSNHVENFKKAFHKIWWKDRRVFWTVMLGGIISTTTLAAVWFSQPYMENIGLQITFFGVIWALGNFGSAAGNYMSHRLNMMSETLQYTLIIGLVAVGLLGMAIIPSIIGVLMIVVIRFAWGLLTPLSQEVVNRMVGSELRVTILSIKSLMQKMMFIILGPLYGWVSDVYSLSTALLLSVGVLLVISLVSLIGAKRSGALR